MQALKKEMLIETGRIKWIKQKSLKTLEMRIYTIALLQNYQDIIHSSFIHNLASSRSSKDRWGYLC